MRRRLLFAAAGGHGHLQPLLPLAEQAVVAGHQVLVTGAASLASHVATRGLPFVASGPDLQPVHAPLVVRGTDEERQAVANHFVARLGPARARAVLDLCKSWRPHLVVRDEIDFGAAVAAEAAGLPHVAVVVLGAGGFLLTELVREPLQELSAAFGVDSGGAELLHRHLTLTQFPASFRHPAHPLPGRVLGYRVPAQARAERGNELTAFVTLGTIYNTESGDLLRTAALGAAGVAGVREVVVATGEHVDRAVLGELPPHVVVHRFVDQGAVLAQSDVVVSHAGSGTVLGALQHGLPTVSLPLGADQHLNAERLQDLGLGVTLPANAATAQDIGLAIEAVLPDPEQRRQLQAMREEVDRQPTALQAVQEMVGLTA